jgi:hypothetical protein
MNTTVHRSRVTRVARTAAGLTVSLTVLAGLAITLGGSLAVDRARELWGDK